MNHLQEISMRMSRLCFPLVAVLAFPALAQNVPTRVNFTARMVDNGTPVQGNRDFIFKLFPTIMGGTETWTETRNSVPVNDGAVNIDLGASTPLTPTILDGQTLYLEVTVAGTVLTPRTAVVSVPYAVRSTVAAQVGTLTAAQIQQRVSSACGAGAAIQTINADGTVVCQSVGANDAGVTTITNITAAAGLTGGGSTGNVSLAVNFAGSGTAVTASRSDHNHTGTYLPLGPVLACTGTDKVVGISANGSVVCGVDANTLFSAGAGLALSGANQFSLMSCPATQSLVAGAGGTWSCAPASASLVTGTAPISVSANTVSLTTCGAGEILKMNNGVWTCERDANSGGTVVGVGAIPPLNTSGGPNPTISLAGVVPLANGGTGASLASPSGGPGQFIKQLTAGGALTAAPISVLELPVHRHTGADINTGVVGVANGGTGAALGAPSGGPGQVVKQTTAGGALSVGPLTAGELPPGTQVWSSLPSCPSGQVLQGVSNTGAPICVGPALVDAFFNIHLQGPSGAYVTAWISCITASCNIVVPSAYAYGSAGTIVVTRNSVGSYSISVPALASGSVPQVTDYSGSASTHCRVLNFGFGSVNVLCYNLLP